MKIHLVSDVHLEREPYTLTPGDADVIVIAGDLGEGHLAMKWLEDAYETFAAPIIYVPGNHDFHHFDLDLRLRKLRSDAKRVGYDFLSNDSVVVKGVKFIGATLWTDFASECNQRLAMERAYDKMSDYRSISMDGFDLTPSRVLEEHQKSVAYIEEQIRTSDVPCVVVTHHAPSKLSNQYSDIPWRPYYCSNLDHMISELQPLLWLHGHLHEPVDYYLGKTRIVSNPRGYHGIESYANFDPHKIIVI